MWCLKFHNLERKINKKISGWQRTTYSYGLSLLILFSVNKIQTEAEIFNLGHRNKSSGTKQMSYKTIIECHKPAKRFMGLRNDSDLNKYKRVYKSKVKENIISVQWGWKKGWLLNNWPIRKGFQSFYKHLINIFPSITINL